ncbi:hypothetical protein QE375_001445 [Microbacterium foliorum]|jgi:hypothetical protein|uniref:ESX-1 secretion-associated protein n=2 Tax=Microbacterium TaxID=33882 RepID=A0ABU1HPC2_9MICO|nr:MULTISPECIES: hypothetical protein [Microbacterium]KQR43300.1 hypothetical protein ASF87_15960 [Microbacterium sp. Leaf161]MDR6141891.1 hypothetical protein [Microbacterium foliorum]
MTASNQQIVIDEDELRAHVRALTAAAELLGSAATTAAGGVGQSAFGAMCGPLLGPAVDALADASESTLAAATTLADATATGLKGIVDAFGAIEDGAVTSFRAIEGEL